MKKIAACGFLLMSVMAMGCQAGEDWKERLKHDLPLLGHRNWIVIADSAYPQQSRQGITTLYAGGDQVDAVKEVLAALEKCKHVRANVFTDSELPHVPEKDAAGITEYRKKLDELLKGKAAQSIPHEQIIAKLDDAAKTFKILIIKTDLAIPYTSVFLQLDCGYWNADAEKRLREALEAKK